MTETNGPVSELAAQQIDAGNKLLQDVEPATFDIPRRLVTNQ